MPSSTNPPRRIQKVCTVWTHDADFSTEDVVFNSDRFAELKLSPNSLAQIIPIPQGSTVKDFVRSGKREKEKTPACLTNPSKKQSLNSRSQKEVAVSTFDENGLPLTGVIETDEDRAYVFVAKDATPAMKQKYPTLQVSSNILVTCSLFLLTIDRSQFPRPLPVSLVTAIGHTF